MDSSVVSEEKESSVSVKEGMANEDHAHILRLQQKVEDFCAPRRTFRRVFPTPALLGSIACIVAIRIKRPAPLPPGLRLTSCLAQSLSELLEGSVADCCSELVAKSVTLGCVKQKIRWCESSDRLKIIVNSAECLKVSAACVVLSSVLCSSPE